MQALGKISATRALGEYDPLIEMYGDGVSSNLLRALSSLQSMVVGGELDVSVAWAVNRPAPPGLAQSVILPAEALEGLDAVAAAMRDRSETNGFELVGYVTRLERGVHEGPGVVSLFPTEAEGTEYTQVQLPLDTAAYSEAITAHAEGAKVRVFGTLYKSGRVWKLKGVSGFERVPSEDEAPADGSAEV